MVLVLVSALLVGGVEGYTLISGTNISSSGSGTSWVFGPVVNVSVLWWDATSINSTDLYLNYTLVRDGATNVSITNDWENITVLDGGNYSFNVTCVPSLVNVTGSWENTSACNVSGLWDVIRYITEYDANSCGGANTTYNETNTTSCFYCWPLNSNLTLGQTFNISLACCQVHNWSNGTFGGYLCDNMGSEEYEDNKMLLAAIMLSPLILGFLLLWISHSMSEEHQLFKVFLNLFGFIGFFLSMYLASIMVDMFLSDYEALISGITLAVWVVGSFFFVVMTYYCIWLVRMAIEMMAMRKREKEEY